MCPSHPQTAPGRPFTWIFQSFYLKGSPHSPHLLCGHILTAGLLQPGLLRGPLLHPVETSFAF